MNEKVASVQSEKCRRPGAEFCGREAATMWLMMVMGFEMDSELQEAMEHPDHLNAWKGGKL